MKKILKLTTLTLMGLLVFTGCYNESITDEQGKKWALENGYVEAPKHEESYLGKYKLEYIKKTSDNKLYTICDPLGGTGTIKASCNEAQTVTIEMTKDKIIFKGDNTDKKYDYMLMEGNIVLLDSENGPYLLKKIMLDENIIEIRLDENEVNYEFVFEKI